MITLTVDTESMLSRIENEQDRVLVNEAILAYQGHALRASYVMAWIACAESIKRRIADSSSWDKEAEALQSRIKGMENNQKAIDGKIVEFAASLGMIDEIEAGQLSDVYKNRNIYGHPYERTPSEADVLSAIELVCDAVLTKPMRHKHKFIRGLHEDLFSNRSFLDDTPGAIDEYVQTFVLRRVDPCVYKILVERCWKGLDKIVGDKDSDIFVRRVARFCQTLIIGGNIFGEWDFDDWHQAICHYPKALHIVCSREEILRKIGDRAFASWFSFSLEQAQNHPDEYRFLFQLKVAAVLSERQVELLNKGLCECRGHSLLQTKISLRELFPILKAKFTVYDFSRLGDIFEFAFDLKNAELDSLEDVDQEYLGVCMMSGVHRGAYTLQWILRTICDGKRTVPTSVFKGIVLGTFVDSRRTLRIQEEWIGSVLRNLAMMEPNEATGIIAGVAKSVLDATDHYSSIEEMKSAEQKVREVDGCGLLAEALQIQSENTKWTF